MRVGFDHRIARAHAPGAGRYARELARALAPLTGEGFELALLDLGLEPLDPEVARAALALGPARALRRRRVPLPRRGFARLACALGLGADRLLGSVDLFHHTRRPFLPVRSARESCAIAELPAPGSREEAELCSDLERMHLVFVFSTVARTELERRFGIPLERIQRVHVGCEHFARELRAPVPRADPAEILALGAIAHRRRPLALLSAFEALLREGLRARLSFVGRPADAAPDLERALCASPAAAQVEWIRCPVEAELPTRIARASTLVHLAEEELTPVTPLEAFALGTPVVATRLPAFEEALSGAAQLVPLAAIDADPRVLTSHLKLTLNGASDPASRAERRLLAAPFTWERCARESLESWKWAQTRSDEPPRLARQRRHL